MKHLVFIGVLLFGKSILANISVHFLRGNAWIIKEKSNKQIPLNNDELVVRGSKIRLGYKSEIILLNAKKQFLLLRDSTRFYSHTELESLLSKCKPGSLIDNLLNEIGNGLGKKTEEDIRRAYLETKGGVLRSDCFTNRVYFPGSNCTIKQSDVSFRWPAFDSTFRFQVESHPFENPQKSILINRLLMDTLYIPNEKEIQQLKNAAQVNWNVSSVTSETCYYYRLNIISDKDYQQLIDQVNLEISNLSEPTDCLLRKASAFESIGLLWEADLAYKRLIAENGNPIFADLYSIFKLRNGMY